MQTALGCINRPIFIVGSPRSGTSILTWCLGQHPNILMQPESDWIGRFAIEAAISHQIGSARGELSQLSALGVTQEEFFVAFGNTINDLLLSHRAQFEKRSRDVAGFTPAQVHPALQVTRSISDPKRRWVDGTPEYSFHICGLRKFFPQARFVHLARDVVSVVNSMLNFRPTGGGALVSGEQAAYDYWLRAVRHCLQAEHAYGSGIVHRLRYSELVDNPESALRAVLEFVDEPFVDSCLEPLQARINSSNVPANFTSLEATADEKLVAEAKRLSAELQQTSPRLDPSPACALEMETAFDQRVQYVANVPKEYHKAQKIISDLQRRLDETCARENDSTGAKK